MTGNHAQHSLDDTLPAGHGRLAQQAVKRFEGLTRPLQTSVPWPQPLPQGGLGHGRAEQAMAHSAPRLRPENIAAPQL